MYFNYLGADGPPSSHGEVCRLADVEGIGDLMRFGLLHATNWRWWCLVWHLKTWVFCAWGHGRLHFIPPFLQNLLQNRMATHTRIPSASFPAFASETLHIQPNGWLAFGFLMAPPSFFGIIVPVPLLPSSKYQVFGGVIMWPKYQIRTQVFDLTDDLCQQNWNSCLSSRQKSHILYTKTKRQYLRHCLVRVDVYRCCRVKSCS